MVLTYHVYGPFFMKTDFKAERYIVFDPIFLKFLKIFKKTFLLITSRKWSIGHIAPEITKIFY